jgi:hypothetical protein
LVGTFQDSDGRGGSLSRPAYSNRGTAEPCGAHAQARRGGVTPPSPSILAAYTLARLLRGFTALAKAAASSPAVLRSESI